MHEETKGKIETRKGSGLRTNTSTGRNDDKMTFLYFSKSLFGYPNKKLPNKKLHKIAPSHPLLQNGRNGHLWAPVAFLLVRSEGKQVAQTCGGRGGES